MDLISAVTKYFPLIHSLFSRKEFELLPSSRYTDMHKYHFGLGTWIRNNILSKDVALVTLFIKCGIDSLDDMSAFIIDLFYIFSKLSEGSLV